jgi:glycosyltransferase involved in cell wall biosynthesis
MRLPTPNQTGPESRPEVSVVIRTLDEEALIGRCLETLRSQPRGEELDIVVVDSGSRDATLEIAKRFSTRILKIQPESFDYSKALNMGIAAAGGQLIISLSAHAIPREPDWVERMIAPFADDNVAAVGCRQVPWPNAHWRERLRIASMFPDVPRVFAAKHTGTIVFSNVASCFRRSLWERFPFTLPAVEDLDWAQRVVAAGWKVVYEPSASVYHSHDESASRQARRLIDIFRAHDLTERRRRTLALTAWQAGGLFYRDLKAILGLDEPRLSKLRYVLTSLRVAWRFLVEFGGRQTPASHGR